MDLPLLSSRVSPAAGDVSRSRRPSRRQIIQLQLAVQRILASIGVGSSASLVPSFLPGGPHSKSASTSWKKCRRNYAHAEGDQTCGRQWNEALSDHAGCEQAVA